MPRVNMGATFDTISKATFCTKCGDLGHENHHITYYPEKTARLCGKCHRKITRINGREARRVPSGKPWKKLSNQEREKIWRDFIGKTD